MGSHVYGVQTACCGEWGLAELGVGPKMRKKARGSCMHTHVTCHLHAKTHTEGSGVLSFPHVQQRASLGSVPLFHGSFGGRSRSASHPGAPLRPRMSVCTRSSAGLPRCFFKSPLGAHLPSHRPVSHSHRHSTSPYAYLLFGMRALWPSPAKEHTPSCSTPTRQHQRAGSAATSCLAADLGRMFPPQSLCV